MLTLVSTPIGNLGDMSQRALETLQQADVVVSEDTRKTGFLLNHFEIKKPQISFREDNEQRVLPKLMEELNSGRNIALVTDAGTPAISDPGFILVRAALAENIPVTAVPGPTALIMAVILSGLPVHSFTFRGFGPRKHGPRKRWLAIDVASPHTLIFYESPHRLIAFLEDALEVYGDRQAAVANDLTKKFETVLRGSLSELLAQFKENPPLGEYSVVIAGAGEKDLDNSDEED
ncbi:MAG: 16S rRNA (cytidine(1402)-2'-O)-methyltransferase [Anaerolineaceae bacterium]|nr:16S rRNA (cytidine(1402)-2'-O)-methyltransferase [Anaerolineaceae bacterium]